MAPRADPRLALLGAANSAGTTTSVTKSCPRTCGTVQAVSRYKSGSPRPRALAMAASGTINMVRIWARRSCPGGGSWLNRGLLARLNSAVR